MTHPAHGRPASNPTGPGWLNGGAKRLLVVAAIATLVTATSCGGDDDGSSSDAALGANTTATSGSATADDSATSTPGGGQADGGDAADGAVPDACEVIDLDEWEAITGLGLVVPEQDTGLVPGGGTVCGVVAEGTLLPYLVTVVVSPRNSAGGVENLISLLDVYDGMEEIDGIGDRALYWDQNTTYEGDAITDWPLLAFEDGPADVTLAMLADGLGRSELEQLAMAVADQIQS